MNQRSNTITVNIDNKPYRVKRGSTILHAAEQNGIYIPTLCNHKDLSPYGGCLNLSGVSSDHHSVGNRGGDQNSHRSDSGYAKGNYSVIHE